MLKKIMLSAITVMSLTTFSFAKNEIINFNNDKLELNNKVINQETKNVKYYSLNKILYQKKYTIGKRITSINTILSYITYGNYSGNGTDKDTLLSIGIFFSHTYNQNLNSFNIDIRTTKIDYENDDSSKINDITLILNGTNPREQLYGKFGIHYVSADAKELSKGLIFIGGVNKYKYYSGGFGSAGVDIYVRRLNDLSNTVVQFTPNVNYLKYLPDSRSIKFITSIDIAKSSENLGPENKTLHYGLNFTTKYFTPKYNIAGGIFYGKETGLVGNSGYIAYSSTEERKYGINGEFTYYINKKMNINYKFIWNKYKSKDGNPSLKTNTLLFTYKF